MAAELHSSVGPSTAHPGSDKPDPAAAAGTGDGLMLAALRSDRRAAPADIEAEEDRAAETGSWTEAARLCVVELP